MWACIASDCRETPPPSSEKCGVIRSLTGRASTPPSPKASGSLPSNGSRRPGAGRQAVEDLHPGGRDRGQDLIDSSQLRNSIKTTADASGFAVGQMSSTRQPTNWRQGPHHPGKAGEEPPLPGGRTMDQQEEGQGQHPRPALPRPLGRGHAGDQGHDRGVHREG